MVLQRVAAAAVAGDWLRLDFRKHGGRPRSNRKAHREADQASKRDSNPALIAHSALIYGITGHGRIATIYPANFTPAQILHDVPRLAAA